MPMTMTTRASLCVHVRETPDASLNHRESMIQGYLLFKPRYAEPCLAHLPPLPSLTHPSPRAPLTTPPPASRNSTSGPPVPVASTFMTTPTEGAHGWCATNPCAACFGQGHRARENSTAHHSAAHGWNIRRPTITPVLHTPYHTTPRTLLLSRTGDALVKWLHAQTEGEPPNQSHFLRCLLYASSPP